MHGKAKTKIVCYTLSYCGWKANNIGSERLETVLKMLITFILHTTKPLQLKTLGIMKI